MNLKHLTFLIAISYLLSACANYKVEKAPERKYFSSSGFALIYADNIFKGVMNKKLNNDKIVVVHGTLKKNTPIKILNPKNSKYIESKIYTNAKYPKIFNIVITKKIASFLELDTENPFVEVFEIKKNKKFVAKEGNTFDEEKNVADKAPVEKIKMDVLTKNNETDEEKLDENNSFILIVNDFYYLDSADSLKNELIKKVKVKNFYVKKINNKKYRLYAGPFKNFNALKTLYISLNDLGFESLNILKE